jgi:hypothetical protein
MGPANCRGLLKFAMSSIAACAGRKHPRPAATAQRLVFMEPSLGDRYDREEFWGKQLPIAFVRQNTKNFARLSSARGRRILGRISGCTTRIGAIQRYRGQETASFWGPSSPQRQYHPRARRARPVLGHHAAHECRQCGLRQSRTGALSWARSRSRSK